VFSTPAKADVTAEWRLLADARKALRAGRLAAASTALAAYRARFTNGRLDEEFWLLRIRVLLARGQTAAAQEAARSYRRRHSEGAMRALIEQLFEEK
jgi:outer membrane protein assembly factor BamD (BamD/ComL family)